MRLMDLVLEQDWRELFRLAAEVKAARHEEEARRFYAELDREKQQKHKREEKEKKEAKELEDALATSAQLAAFDGRLDDYDTKTVHALMENGEALDRVRDELRAMREEAYVLPDGRRVFKTQDGQRVFDEHGAEVGRDTIDPQIIADHHTKYEPFEAARNAEDRLQTERQGLLDFQAKLDETRSRVHEGNISKKELDALDADLKASAPPAVRAKLGLPAAPSDREAKPDRDALPPAQLDELVRRAQAVPTLTPH